MTEHELEELGHAMAARLREHIPQGVMLALCLGMDLGDGKGTFIAVNKVHLGEPGQGFKFMCACAEVERSSDSRRWDSGDRP